MKKIVFITLSLLLAVSFWNCEKDDICAEGTAVTPLVIIEFYDATTTTVLKSVTNLGVIAPSFTTGFSFTGVTKIKVPLRTSADLTSLHFIQNGSDADTTNDNIDLLTFNYVRNDVYISRACGYKTVFFLDATNPIALTTDGNNWIQNIEVVQPNIVTENEVHVKIYF